MLAFTIDRKLFVGPEAAYQRANEYVRKAVNAGCPSGVWVAALELQGKTGDGWPHWHVLVWCPDRRPVREIEAAILRAWRTRTAEYDPQTGEVLSWSSERIGFVSVRECRSAKGAGIYCAKYVTKGWPAVAPWMLQSCRRFRKVRVSNGAYVVLEKLGRHQIVHGPRREHKRDDRRRRARTLLDRMASSGGKLAVFRVGPWGRLSFRCVVPISVEQVVERKLRPVRLGPWRRVLWEVPEWVIALRDKWRPRAESYERERAGWISVEWAEMQEREAGKAEGRVEPCSGVAGT
jgi:hypothetical protein